MQEETDREKEETPTAPAPERDLLEFGCVTTARDETVQTMLIAGQIEGHTALGGGAKATRYEHVLPQLVKAEESPEIGGMLFLLNTVGGDVEAGLAMAEMIAGMTKPTVSLVLGGGHSIGIPLAVAAKKTLIAPSATMTVHPVRINGLVLGAPQSFEYLGRMQDRIVDFIVHHSRATPERMEAWMMGRIDMATDLGTIVDAREAVDGGLCDGVGTFSDAMRLLKDLIRAAKT